MRGVFLLVQERRDLAKGRERKRSRGWEEEGMVG